MRFDIITIFPKIFDSYLNESILKRSQDKKIIQIKTHNLRDFAKHKKARPTERRQSFGRVDDKPYGGGAGMVMMAEPIVKAVDKIRKNIKGNSKVILFSAKGKFFNQKMAYDLAKKYKNLIFISGRYEGIDERVKKIIGNWKLEIEELSIGPYVLTDGDVAAMIVISAVSRLIPGTINFESLTEESYFNSIIQSKAKKGVKGVEYPHYTRPEIIVYKGKKYKVPKVLLSGNHEKISQWRKSKIK